MPPTAAAEREHGRTAPSEARCLRQPRWGRRMRLSRSVGGAGAGREKPFFLGPVAGRSVGARGSGGWCGQRPASPGRIRRCWTSPLKMPGVLSPAYPFVPVHSRAEAQLPTLRRAGRGAACPCGPSCSSQALGRRQV